MRCAFAASISICCTNRVLAETPIPSDPNSMAPSGSLPGAYPTRVSAANVNAAPAVGSVIGGSGSNTMLVSIPAASPEGWTESRHNEGDIALLIAPFDPQDASYYPPTTFFENYQPLEGQPFANTTLAWRVNRSAGALLASVRHNGVNNQDTYNGTPVGITNGIAYFNADLGQGWGYRMSDGVFANGGEGSADLQMGVAGFDEGLGEAVFNTAVSFFPYAQGWTGAYVNAGDNNEASFSASSEGLDPSTVTWTNGIAKVTLPGVNSASDGMLFVAPTNGGNSSDIAAAFPADGGWTVTIREDEDATFDGSNYNDSGNSFQFLYVPYTASNLIGGQVSGADASLVNGAGSERMQITRTTGGEYAVTVFAADGVTPLTEDDGMLILSGSGSMPGNAALADRTFFSYEYDSNSQAFVVQSREVAAISSELSANVFGDYLALRDSDFYFAWVDFNNPLSLDAGQAADFNNDGQVDDADFALWEASFAADGGGDANGDGVTDGSDFLIW
ncbi:MAG: hypothetical protein KDA61_13840, partial [Planctomycetales bacterium]|nr:hypothetical protein [Planctomycetales bacterium]